MACHLFWVLPDYRPAASIPAEARTAPQFRLVTANLLYTNTRLSELIAEIEAASPDVLFLQEYSPRAAELIAKSRLQSELPYFAGIARYDSTGTAILSRYPLSDVRSQRSGPPMTSATLDFNGQPIRLVTMHPLPPTGGGATDRWNRELRSIAEFASEPPRGPFVLAGDLNLTQHHRWYGRIVNGPLADALRKLGMGNATTWPNGKLGVPSIRIDQVFISDEVVPLRARIGKGYGSDHRPVVIDLAILPTREVDAREPVAGLP